MTIEIFIYFVFAVICLVFSIWIHSLSPTDKTTSSLIDIQFLIPIVFSIIALILSYLYKPALMYYLNLLFAIFSASATLYFINKYSENTGFLLTFVKSLLLTFIISNAYIGFTLSLNYYIIKIDRMVYLPRITVPIATPSIIGNMFYDIKCFILVFIFIFITRIFLNYYHNSINRMNYILRFSILFISIFIFINIYNINFLFPDPNMINDDIIISKINLLVLIIPLTIFTLVIIYVSIKRLYFAILGSFLLFFAFSLSIFFFTRLYDFRSLWITVLSNREFLFSIIIEILFLLGFAFISYGIMKGYQKKITNHEVVQ